MSEQEPTPLPPPELSRSAQRRLQLPALHIEGPFLEEFEPNKCEQTFERVLFVPDDKKKDTAHRHAAFETIMAPASDDFFDSMQVERALHYSMKHPASTQPLIDEQGLRKLTKRYTEPNLADTRALFGVMEYGLHTYKGAYGPPFSPEEQKAFTNLVIAHELLCLGGLRLVDYLARNYSFATNISRSDLFQEGAMGLLKAVRQFDAANRSHEFTGSASWAIKGNMLQFLAESGKNTGLSAASYWNWRRIQRVRAELQQELGGKSPTNAQIAERTDISESGVEALISLKSMEPVSLDRPVGTDERGASLLDFIPSLTMDDDVERRYTISQINDIAALANLSDEEWFVIGLKYGFSSIPMQLAPRTINLGDRTIDYDTLAEAYLVGDEQDGLSIDTISQVLRLDRERVKALERQAMRELRGRAYKT